VIRDSVAREARDSIYAAAARPVHHRDLSAHLPFGSYAEQGMHTKAPSRFFTLFINTTCLFITNITIIIAINII